MRDVQAGAGLVEGPIVSGELCFGIAFSEGFRSQSDSVGACLLRCAARCLRGVLRLCCPGGIGLTNGKRTVGAGECVGAWLA